MNDFITFLKKGFLIKISFYILQKLSTIMEDLIGFFENTFKNGIKFWPQARCCKKK